MLQFLAALLRGVIATLVGLLIAGGTLTLAADRAPIERPTLVPVAPGPAILDVPDVTGQAYVFAKGILQDRGFAWHVTGPVLGYAANTVATQSPSAGTTVLDNGAPVVTLTLARNPSYVESGTPENDAPYRGTPVSIPATAREKPTTTVAPHLEPVQGPVAAAPPPVQPVQTPVPSAVPSPVRTPTPVRTPVPVPPQVQVPRPTAVKPTPVIRPTAAAKRKPVSAPGLTGGLRTPDFVVPGAPKEPPGSPSLPEHVSALAAWIEAHPQPSATNLNHWLYEHAYVVAGGKFGWWHGAAALQALIEVDKRAEALWGVGIQSRTAAEKTLAEVRPRGA